MENSEMVERAARADYQQAIDRSGCEICQFEGDGSCAPDGAFEQWYVDGYKTGYDAGQSARPEPPEPDGDLVEAAEKYFNEHIMELTRRATDESQIHRIMASFAQQVLEQHAARADAPADVCECSHEYGWHFEHDNLPSGRTGCGHPHCPCTQFTPAPTSPERRIAAELRAVLEDGSAPTRALIFEYIDKLEGKQ